MNRKIAFIGGDSRQTVVISELSREYEVAVVGFDLFHGDLGLATRCDTVEDAVKDCFAVVLPLPYSRDKLHVFAPLGTSEILVEDTLSAIGSDTLLYGGMIDDYLKNRAHNTRDYYKDEELQIMNSVPTAEGAIAIAMDELDITLFGANALVIGFGRVAKLLASRLFALGVDVTVCARREDDRAYAKAYGYDAVDFSELPEALGKADVIFNSVPERVIDSTLYPYVRRDVPFIDLASRPGGIDFEKAKQFGMNIIWALSLPGKVAPVTAGKIIATTLKKLLRGEERNA